MDQKVIEKVSALFNGQKDGARRFQFVMLRWANPELSDAEIARQAGYAKSSAPQMAHRLLHKIESVQQAMEILRADSAERSGITRDWWLEKQVKVINRSMSEEAVLDKEGNPVGEYRFDSSGANKGLDNLAKAEGYYKPQELNVKGLVGTMEIEDDTDPAKAAEIYQQIIQ